MSAYARTTKLGLGLMFWAVCGLAMAQRLDAGEARYLLTRSGFAPTSAETAAITGLSREQAVDKILSQAGAAALAPTVVRPPEWTGAELQPRKRFQDMSVEERKLQQELGQQQTFALRTWWLEQMRATPSPLSERMTLFWHNHFVSSYQKVRSPQLMYRQNQTFREYAVGNFAGLLHAAAKDPAMLIYLDNATSRKGAPNENLAREMMELFTLGEGKYSEQDVKEVARAFTGWSVERETEQYRWRPQLHDTDSKTVLGRSGNFDGDAVLDILLAQPACAEFIVTKLWREFISPDPDPAEVQRIARQFRESRYDLKIVLRELFLAPVFWDQANRAHLVKSPVEMVIGALKQFDIHYDDALPFTFAVAQLGQNLFNPPNVKGWPGGDAWLNTTTLMSRKSVLERVVRPVDTGQAAPALVNTAALRESTQSMGRVPGQAALGPAGRVRFANAITTVSFDADRWLGQFGVPAGARPDAGQRLAMQKTVLASEPSVPIRADLNGTGYLHSLLMDPVYQLK
jgi:uncharacterized protein (DUF1800 family)